MLHTAPSFSIYNSTDGDEGEKKIEEEVEREKEGALLRPLKLGPRVESVGSGDFSFGKSSSMTLIEERDEKEEDVREIGDSIPSSPPMYLATGLGFGGGGGGDFAPVSSFGDLADAEEYYKRMVDENPTNPLVLGNYAKILESKVDLEGAEEFYFRASFVDPKDGEVQMRYGRLVWQLHHDQYRARDYFERAILATPEDSDVLAAYARFLWEIEEEKEDGLEEKKQNQIGEPTRVPIQNTAFEDGKESAGHLAKEEGVDDGVNTEDYYKRIADENPSNSISLRNYAQFLYKTKRDLIAAEGRYTRAIHADPSDGETKSQYAQLIWEIHRDRREALSFFEQAVEASPEDSNVLAAYARFLWEAEENEDDDYVAIADV